jgi:hypothetical protein
MFNLCISFPSAKGCKDYYMCIRIMLFMIAFDQLIRSVFSIPDQNLYGLVLYFYAV